MDDINQKIEERIIDLEKRISILETGIQILNKVKPLTQSVVKQISAKEFLLSKKISTAMDKTLALAYYLEHIGQVSPFRVEDLSSVFQSAREKFPANFNDMINKNIAKGFIMETRERKDGKKAWILTASGEKFVESNLKS